MKKKKNAPHLGATAYIFLFSEIEAVALEKFCALLRDLSRDIQVLTLVMATGGGSVSEGIAFYNLLRALPYKVITHNIASVDSIGNIVFMAGQERYASARATFLIHSVKSSVKEKHADSSLLKEKLLAIEADNQRLQKLYVEHTRIPPRDLEQFFISGHTCPADYALKTGLIDSILELKLPAEAYIREIAASSPEED